MKSEHFTSSSGSLRIEGQRIDGSWQYIAWRPNTSRMFADSHSLLRWAAWPIKTPTGDALRQWLSSLEEAPAEPVAPTPPTDSWDPQAHLDESDPNHQTRTIV